MITEYNLDDEGFKTYEFVVAKETEKQYQYEVGFKKKVHRINKSECNKIKGRWGSYIYFDTNNVGIGTIKELFNEYIINEMLGVREKFEREAKNLNKIKTAIYK